MDLDVLLAQALHEARQTAGREGSKMSIPRIADRAGYSEKAVRNLFSQAAWIATHEYVQPKAIRVRFSRPMVVAVVHALAPHIDEEYVFEGKIGHDAWLPHPLL